MVLEEPPAAVPLYELREEQQQDVEGDQRDLDVPAERADPEPRGALLGAATPVGLREQDLRREDGDDEEDRGEPANVLGRVLDLQEVEREGEGQRREDRERVREGRAA